MALQIRKQKHVHKNFEHLFITFHSILYFEQ